MERHPFLVIAGFSALFLAVCWLVSATRPMWFDELGAYYMARLPGVTELLRFHSDGLDVHTPLCSLIERASLGILGDSAFGARAPSMLAYLLLCLCVWRFVAVRAGVLWGFAAMLFPLLGQSLYYATEARPYALAAGVAAFAAVCWQAAQDGTRRGLAVLLLWLSLVLVISLHYYGVFLLIPFALAEAVRWRFEGRVDWAAGAAVASPPLVLLAFVPAIQKARAMYGASMWSRPRLSQVVSTYRLLAEGACPAIAVAFFIACGVLILVRREDRAPAAPAPPPLAEQTLLWSWALLPVLVVPASFLTGSYVERYMLPVSFGLAAALALVAWRGCGGDRRVAVLASAVFLAWFLIGVRSTVNGQLARTGGYPFATSEPFAAKRWAPAVAASRLPVVAVPAVFFLEYQHYAPLDQHWRIYYTASREHALEMEGTDSADACLINYSGRLRSFYIRPYDDFVLRNRNFLLLVETNISSWVPRRLKADGAELIQRESDGSQYLYEVRFP